MPLPDAIESLIRARGLSRRDVAADWHMDPATFYRLLRGDTADPTLKVLIGCCVAFDVTPNELLELAQLWSPPLAPSAAGSDVRLRPLFARLLALDERRKGLALRLAYAVLSVVEEAGAPE